MAEWTKAHAWRHNRMSRAADKRHLSALMGIPGVGEKTAEDLWAMDIRTPDELRERDPQQLYDTLCSLRGITIDRCQLYVFRCAVYYASRERHDPELLKWWNWKDA
ncbi:MAG: helix-hairpin-helix domain-containing protein [Actinomycetota bacterium]